MCSTNNGLYVLEHRLHKVHPVTVSQLEADSTGNGPGTIHLLPPLEVAQHLVGWRSQVLLYGDGGDPEVDLAGEGAWGASALGLENGQSDLLGGNLDDNRRWCSRAG